MKSLVNWGIIGLGKIANSFANDLQLSKTANLYGVASRNLEKAKNFGKKIVQLNTSAHTKSLPKTPK